ncbi:MAG: hypothetical protein PWR26_898 [Methanosarcinales archaeon]|nr:MAG: Flavoprotein [Euryarchaeota archaeon 55_53]KUK30632.1 MAG: Flavoprotein [Methanosarcinales archeaon 56_1174]MDI3488181.1 hypothetical protein [Methanosarcinales archaeon]MDN5295456.1 hypothetical protein [Methanosarcinales archaeon]
MRGLSLGDELCIAWAITGAGHLLTDSIEAVSVLKARHPGLKITTFLSAAAVEVCRLYGVLERIGNISKGGYLEEVFVDEHRSSYPKSGRFQIGRYRALVVSPATSNTVAKAVYGIADSLVSNCIAMATKSRVPTLIVPVDAHAETVASQTPYLIDRALCVGCECCHAGSVCPTGAIRGHGTGIDTSLCTGCGVCVEACPHGAIRRMEAVLTPRQIDLENIERLKRIEGVSVGGTGDIVSWVEDVLFRTPRERG